MDRSKEGSQYPEQVYIKELGQETGIRIEIRVFIIKTYKTECRIQQEKIPDDIYDFEITRIACSHNKRAFKVTEPGPVKQPPGKESVKFTVAPGYIKVTGQGSKFILI